MDPLRETASNRPTNFETNIIHIISRPLPKILYEYEQNYLTGKEHRTFLCYFLKFYVKYNLFLSDAFEMKANFRSGKRIFKCKIRVELRRVPPKKLIGFARIP